MRSKKTEAGGEPKAPSVPWEVRVGKLVLPMFAEGDGPPRMLDLEWARMLGFQQPRNIRRLIQKMITEKKLRDVHVVTTPVTTPMPRGGTRTVQVEEFWLTQEQCFLVATQSDAPHAWTLTMAIVEVFSEFEEHLDLPGVCLPPRSHAGDA